MLINDTYFVGDISIPKQDAPYNADLNLAIKRYEAEYLQMVLGPSLYEYLLFELDQPTLSDRFQKLINGELYYHPDDVTNLLIWGGLANMDTLKTPIAYYVYAKFVSEGEIKNHSVGTAQLLIENGQRVNPFRNTLRAWDRCIEMTGGHWEQRHESSCVYDLCGINPKPEKCSNTLVNYLAVHADDFPRWKFQPLPERNGFNL